MLDIRWLPTMLAGAVFGLLGFYVGVLLVPNAPTATISISERPGERTALKVAMLASVALLFAAVVVYGIGEWFTGEYGSRQFEYGLHYYLITAAQLVAYPAFIGYAAITLGTSRRHRGLVAFVVIFGGLLFLNGARGPLLILTGAAVAVANYRTTRLQPRKLAKLVALGALVVLGSGLVRARVLDPASFPQSTKNAAAALLAELAWPGAVTTRIMSLVPATIPWQEGATYWAAFQNLFPGFLDDVGLRTLPPSLVFQRAVASQATGQGFGFAVTGEAYMNWGLVGAFPVLLVLGLSLAGLHSRLRRGSHWNLAIYVAVLVHSLWFLRADSTAFVKAVLYSAAVLALARSVGQISINRGARLPYGRVRAQT